MNLSISFKCSEWITWYIDKRRWWYSVHIRFQINDTYYWNYKYLLHKSMTIKRIMELNFYLKIINKLKCRAVAFCNEWQRPTMSGVIVCYLSSTTKVYQRLRHKIAFRHVFVASNTSFRYMIFQTYVVQNKARYHVSSKKFLWNYPIKINKVQKWYWVFLYAKLFRIIKSKILYISSNISK